MPEPTPAHADLKLSPALIHDDGRSPLYQQVIGVLRERIVSGQAPLGSRLPPEHELTTLLGVSRITIKRALNELASSGLVRRHRGRGTVVTFDPAAPTVKASFDTLIDGLTRMGLTTRAQLLAAETREAPPDIAARLELNAGAPVRRVVRARHLEGAPFSHLIAHIPEAIAVRFPPEALATQSLIALLEQAGHAPQSAQQTISATSAGAETAAALDLSPAAPVLRIHRIMRDAVGRPVQDIVATYRPDRFHYQMTLTRGAGSDWRTDD